MASEIVNRETGEITQVEPSIGGMMQTALEKGVSADAIKSLCEAYITLQDRDRAREFSTSMSTAQREMPPVKKDAERVITAGVKAPYASRLAIQSHLAEHLNKYGLSYSLHQSVDADGVTVRCDISHDNGFTKSYSYTHKQRITANDDTAKATTSAIRGVLALAFSIVIGDPEIDSDGDECISQDDVEYIARSIAELKINQAVFLRLCQASSVEDIRARMLPTAITAIETKRNTGKKP